MGTKIQEQKFQKIMEQKLEESGNKNNKNLSTKILEKNYKYSRIKKLHKSRNKNYKNSRTKVMKILEQKL
jgi:hypothetical protein